MNISALILAAGYSSRMGDFKPLLTINNKTLLAHCVSRFKQAGIRNIVVVTGHKADDLISEANSLGVDVVHNRKHDQGMFSSVIKGVKSMRQYEGFFLLPVDIPLFHTATVTSLIQSFDGNEVLIPVYRHQQGHPPLIPCKYIKKIIEHDGQNGLRGILTSLPMSEIKVWDRGILLDADTPEAFFKLKKRSNAISSSDIETEEAEEMARLLMSQSLIEHCKAVSILALEFAEKLDSRGYKVNKALLYNGALLHDIAKGQIDHEQAGKAMMQGFGFEKIAAIVGSHRSTPVPQNEELTEKELVCLADKFIKGTDKLSLPQRFEDKLNRFADDPNALTAIRERYNESTELFSLVEKQLATSINSLVERVKIP